jgi:hypothetical protein
MKPPKKKLGQLLWVLAACIGLDISLSKSLADTDAFWVLEPLVVHRLEARIVMPKGANPIDAYTRYYESGFDHGRRTVFGLLTEGGDRQIHISGHNPVSPLDGGCSVVNLTFDVATGQVTLIECNGLA